MKIKKNEIGWRLYYSYGNRKNYTWHGLYNNQNEYIGYYYQNNEKGFWLINHKF